MRIAMGQPRTAAAIGSVTRWMGAITQTVTKRSTAAIHSRRPWLSEI